MTKLWFFGVAMLAAVVSFLNLICSFNEIDPAMVQLREIKAAVFALIAVYAMERWRQ